MRHFNNKVGLTLQESKSLKIFCFVSCIADSYSHIFLKNFKVGKVWRDNKNYYSKLQSFEGGNKIDGANRVVAVEKWINILWGIMKNCRGTK